jgi:hypothetical protein
VRSMLQKRQAASKDMMITSGLNKDPPPPPPQIAVGCDALVPWHEYNVFFELGRPVHHGSRQHLGCIIEGFRKWCVRVAFVLGRWRFVTKRVQKAQAGVDPTAGPRTSPPISSSSRRSWPLGPLSPNILQSIRARLENHGGYPTSCPHSNGPGNTGPCPSGYNTDISPCHR